MAICSSGDHSFIVYVDESGDEGWRFINKSGNKGSSEWLTLGAAVFRADTELSQVKCVDAARTAMGRQASKAIHFADLKHEHKVLYCREIAKASMRPVVVAMHKPSLFGRVAFRQKRYLYHYASKLLLERVSWLCRDRYADRSRPVGGDGTAHVVFSHRRVFSRTEFQSYLNLLRRNGGSGIEWGVIDSEHVESKPHQAYRGLQIADALASAFSTAIEKHPEYGITEGRYIAELERTFYRNGDRILSYGVKPFPSDATEEMALSEWDTVRKMAGPRSQSPPRKTAAT